MDESARAIVEVLTRLDLRLAAIEAKVDAVLAVMSRPEKTQTEAKPEMTMIFDRRQRQDSFDGSDRRMGEI